MTENPHVVAVIGRAPWAWPPPPTSPRAGSSRSSSRPALPSVPSVREGGTCACSRRGSTTSIRSRPRCWPRPAGRPPTRPPTRPDRTSSSATEPLAALPEIAPALHLGARVLAVTRHGIDKLKDAGREEAPFELVVEEGGEERRYLASAVIDASGRGRVRIRSAPVACPPRASARWPAGSRTASRTCSAPTVRATRAGACSWWAAGTRRSTRSSISSRCATPSPRPRSCGRSAVPRRDGSTAAVATTSCRRAARSARRSAVAADGSVELVGGFQTRRVSLADVSCWLTRTSLSPPTRSSRRPGSAPTCRCSGSCGSTSTIASRRRARSLR